MAIRKPTPKPLPRQARRPAPLDLVRNPNFDAAMAQQNYDNFIARQRARMAAQQGQFTQGRLMGAPTEQGGFDSIAQTMSTSGQPIQQQPQTLGTGQISVSTQGSIDPRNPNSIYNNLQPYVSQVGSVPMRNPQNPNQMNFGQIASGMQNITNSNPQQQMQNYQNFLQQGMQNSNTMNQGAMNNFANMQPGMQATQTASTATPNQTMPVAGMGMQKSSPAPRKFSITSNPQVKAF
jgi:hypothetical protein